MRITIEDLEALKELNDELEENHVETEQAMQEEISKHTRIAGEEFQADFVLQTPRITTYANKHGRSRAWRKRARTLRARLYNSASLSCSYKRACHFQAF